MNWLDISFTTIKHWFCCNKSLSDLLYYCSHTMYIYIYMYINASEFSLVFSSVPPRSFRTVFTALERALCPILLRRSLSVASRIEPAHHRPLLGSGQKKVGQQTSGEWTGVQLGPGSGGQSTMAVCSCPSLQLVTVHLLSSTSSVPCGWTLPSGRTQSGGRGVGR